MCIYIYTVYIYIYMFMKCLRKEPTQPTLPCKTHTIGLRTIYCSSLLSKFHQLKKKRCSCVIVLRILRMYIHMYISWHSIAYQTIYHKPYNTHTHTCVYMYKHTHICVPILYIRPHTYIYPCIRIYIYIYMCVYTYAKQIHNCIFIYIYTYI